MFEKYNWQQHLPQVVIGVDEAGRGCLAGPVVAAACILNPQQLISGLTDSKKLSATTRERLYETIVVQSRFCIGEASAEEIDQMNILEATHLAMRRAIEGLGSLDPQSTLVLVDGNMKVRGLQLPQIALVKGDLRAEPISAASILAKVHRDRLVTDFEINFPSYQFAKHKGYGTELHRKLISEFGPTAQHRRTFRGVKEYLHIAIPAQRETRERPSIHS